MIIASIFRVELLAICFHAGILLGLFDIEDEGYMILRNVDSLSRDYMALYPTVVRTSDPAVVFVLLFLV
jgi:hypothetical protein